MSVEPREILVLAQGLRLEDSEVVRRAAISRAYYAAMHEAKTLLPEQDEAEFRGSSHEKLTSGIRAFFQGVVPGRSVGAAIAGQLVALKGKRVAADYQLGNDISVTSAESSVLVAARIFELCNQVRALRMRS